MQESTIDTYIKIRQERTSQEKTTEASYEFEKLCELVKEYFLNDWENRESTGASLEIQKRAIIGYEKEKNYFKERISEIVKTLGAANTSYPLWYENLIDGIYHENWGLAGLSEWFSDVYAGSSSAKIISNNIFFMINGKMELMPQKISERRKEQLIKAFMLLNPEERMDKSYYEIYMLDGTRVTIFAEPMSKKGQSAIVFRRYIVPTLSFEEQASRGTIPVDAIPMFKAMVRVGYNVIFMGAVRTAKTTFLSTWQSYEDPNLEGVMVETDPSLPLGCTTRSNVEIISILSS